MYYDYGIEFEEYKADVLVGRIAVGFFGVEDKPKPQVKDNDPTPDRRAFYERYGDKIKRPKGGET